MTKNYDSFLADDLMPPASYDYPTLRFVMKGLETTVDRDRISLCTEEVYAREDLPAKKPNYGTSQNVQPDFTDRMYGNTRRLWLQR